GGHAPARGRAPRAPDGASLPGELVRDVRQSGGDAPARDDSVLSALPVWRRQGVRSLDHRQLSRVLRAVRRQRHPLQSRVAAPRADPSKATRELGWTPTTSFADLVRMMVDADLERLS